MKRIGFITLIILVAFVASGCGASHSDLNSEAERMGLSNCIITKQGGWTIGEARCEIPSSKGETCTATFKIEGSGDEVTFNPKSKKCKPTKG
jgi:hypothetical protein